MPKHNEDFKGCLELTLHHVDAYRMRMKPYRDASPAMLYRIKLVRENMEAALARLAVIREAAERGRCKEVLKLLDECVVPAGHEFPRTDNFD